MKAANVSGRTAPRAGHTGFDPDAVPEPRTGFSARAGVATAVRGG